MIREQFTGANHMDLSRRFGVSLAHVYKILSEGRTGPRFKQEELF